jgi:hypothetical protein
MLPAIGPRGSRESMSDALTLEDWDPDVISREG